MEIMDIKIVKWGWKRCVIASKRTKLVFIATTMDKVFTGGVLGQNQLLLKRKK